MSRRIWPKVSAAVAVFSSIAAWPIRAQRVVPTPSRVAAPPMMLRAVATRWSLAPGIAGVLPPTTPERAADDHTMTGAIVGALLLGGAALVVRASGCDSESTGSCVAGTVVWTLGGSTVGGVIGGLIGSTIPKRQGAP